MYLNFNWRVKFLDFANLFDVWKAFAWFVFRFSAVTLKLNIVNCIVNVVSLLKGPNYYFGFGYNV